MKPGDIVCLKSGGFPMTVLSDSADFWCVCAWHDDNGAPRQERYPVAALRMMPAEKPAEANAKKDASCSVAHAMNRVPLPPAFLDDELSEVARWLIQEREEQRRLPPEQSSCIRCGLRHT